MIDCDECLSIALAEVYQFIRERQQERREGAFLAELPSRRGQIPDSETLTPYDTMGLQNIQGGPVLEALARP